MKNKRKFLSIFAIVFALVFALSVCFFAACGKKDDDEKESDTTTEQDGGNEDDGDNDGDDDDNEGNENPATVSGVTLTADNSTLEVGETATLTATVTMSDGGAYAGSYKWTSSVADCVTVDETATTATNTATAVAPGTSVITVTVDDNASATCSVTVAEPAPISVATTEGLEEAFKVSGSYRLDADVVGSFTVEPYADVVFDLAGHTVSTGSELTGAENTIKVSEGASLTIVDSSVGEDGAGTGAVENTYSAGTSLDNAAAIFTEGELVLNGGTIESSSVGIRAQAGTVEINGGTISADYFSIWEDKGEVTVTINGGTVESTRKGIFVGGDSNFGYSDLEDGTEEGKLKYNWQEDAKTTLIVTGGVITSEEDSAISTLGTASVESAIISISGGEISSAYTIEGYDGNSNTYTPDEGDATNYTFIPAIFFPSGTLTISGDAEISGATALEVKGGNVTISGGTFTSTVDVQNTPEWRTSGAVSYGYAFAAFPYGETQRSHEDNVHTNIDTTFNNTLDVTVSGGTFDGSVYFYDVENGTDTDSYGQELEYTYAVIGGAFKENPSDYVAEGYTVNGNETEGYTVVEDASSGAGETQSVTILFYSGATYPEYIEIVAGDDGPAYKDITNEDGTYQYTYEWEGETYNPLKLTSSQYVNLTLSYDATVEFYVMSGDNNANAQLYIYNGTNNTSDTSGRVTLTSSTANATLTATLTAGGYSICRNSKEMELCYIVITPVAD